MQKNPPYHEHIDIHSYTAINLLALWEKDSILKTHFHEIPSGFLFKYLKREQPHNCSANQFTKPRIPGSASTFTSRIQIQHTNDKPSKHILSPAADS